MPPKTATTTTTATTSTPKQIQAQLQSLIPSELTLLFKHTSHTILLLVPPKETFTSILTTLLSVLQERYPSGLTPMPSSSSSSSSPRPSTSTFSSTSNTPLNTDNNTKTNKNAKIPLPKTIQDIALAVPEHEHEPRKGWMELELALGDTPQGLGLKEGALLAFKFLRGEGEEGEEERGFEVRWPSYEEMYGEVDEGGGEGEGLEDLEDLREERTLGGGEEEEEEYDEDDEDEL